jgi:serine/threonine protein kinase
VTEDWRIKICDFGLSRPDTNSNKDTLAKLRGTMAYCSPEVYNGALFNEKSDIYAIGVVLWELVNRCVKGVYQRPYSEYPFIVYEYQIVLQAAKAGLRPTIPHVS